VNSSYVESIQNGEDVTKEALQSGPQATASDEGDMAPLVPMLSEKPRKSLVIAISLLSEPSLVHSLSTPAPLLPLSIVPRGVIGDFQGCLRVENQRQVNGEQQMSSTG